MHKVIQDLHEIIKASTEDALVQEKAAASSMFVKKVEKTHISGSKGQYVLVKRCTFC